MQVRRLTNPSEVARAAPALARLQNVALAGAPLPRPVQAEEVARAAWDDPHLTDRMLLVAMEGVTLTGWLHLAPPGRRAALGHLCPYVGGEAVPLPGAALTADDRQGQQAATHLYEAALQAWSAAGQLHLDFALPAGADASPSLAGREAAPAEHLALYAAPLDAAPLTRSPVSLRPARPEDLPEIVALAREAGEVDEQFTPQDLQRLMRAVPGPNDKGLLVAERHGVAVAYVVGIMDDAHNRAAAVRRAWVALGTLGLGVSREAQDLELHRSLLQGVMLLLIPRGATELALLVNQQMAESLRDVWRTLGFRRRAEWILRRVATGR